MSLVTKSIYFCIPELKTPKATLHQGLLLAYTDTHITINKKNTSKNRHTKQSQKTIAHYRSEKSKQNLVRVNKFHHHYRKKLLTNSMYVHILYWAKKSNVSFGLIQFDPNYFQKLSSVHKFAKFYHLVKFLHNFGWLTYLRLRSLRKKITFLFTFVRK